MIIILAGGREYYNPRLQWQGHKYVFHGLAHVGDER